MPKEYYLGKDGRAIFSIVLGNMRTSRGPIYNSYKAIYNSLQFLVGTHLAVIIKLGEDGGN